MEKNKNRSFNRKLSLSKQTVSTLNGSMDEIRGGAWRTYYCSNSCEQTICYECVKLSKPPICGGEESDGCWTQTVCAGWNCPTLRPC